jgi:hypothetical protein
MKTTTWITAAALIAVGATAFAVAQDKKAQEAGASKDQIPPAWMMPDDHHKMLETMAGHWNFKLKMLDDGTGKPSESTGTSDRKMVLGGRFLEDVTHGSMMGQPFEGHGFTGYDRIKNKYTGTWMDNMCTCALSMEGTWDAKSKSMAFMTEMPGMDGKMAKSRIVDSMPDNDHITSQFFSTGSDGKEAPMMTIEYTRGK